MFSLISFTIQSPFRFNNKSLESDEDIEVAINFQDNMSEWIPLELTLINKNNMETTTRRGYVIPNIRMLNTAEITPVRHYLEICNFDTAESIRLRWLASSTSLPDKPDIWTLDDIEAILTTGNNNYTLFQDDFNGSMLK